MIQRDSGWFGMQVVCQAGMVWQKGNQRECDRKSGICCGLTGAVECKAVWNGFA